MSRLLVALVVACVAAVCVAGPQFGFGGFGGFGGGGVINTVASQLYNPQYYPGIASGYQNYLYNYNPGFAHGCRYWCRSTFTNQYYCAAPGYACSYF